MSTERALITKLRTLAAGVETTTGTALSLSGTNGAVNVYDASFTANIPANERRGQGSLSPLVPVPGARTGKATFKTEVVGSGTTTDPFWLAVLMATCGFVGTTHVYTPLSGAVATATLGSYIDGRLKEICGAMGKVSFDFEAGNPVMASWEYDGVWIPPTSVSLISPTYPTVQPPRFAAATLTVAGTAYRVGKMTIAVENTIAMRKDANAANNSGYHAAQITDRKITVKMSPEALALGTQDWYAGHLASTSYALSCAVGSAANNTITFAAPAMVLLNPPADNDDNGIYRDDLEFLCTVGSGADTELSITAS